MSNFIVELNNGEKRTFEKGLTLQEIAKSISLRLGKEAIAAKWNGKLVDLSFKPLEDGKLEILTFEDEEGKDIYRHSSAHVMAQAVKRLYPEVVLAIGPSIENGFYYDFDCKTTFTPDDLEKIEEEMRRIIKEDLYYEREELSRDEAIKFFKENGEIYKVELIQDLPEDTIISIYKQGEFLDLCAGPHVPSTGKLKAIKLMNLAGAYWRGRQDNPMLQRIYGTSFVKQKDLEEYLFRLEEAKKRDHRKIGAQMGLFSLIEEGPGFPFFHPKGMVLRNELENFWREEHRKTGYLEIKTPIILNRNLWERSGHWEHFHENMYFTTIDEQEFAIKPMNCPGAMLVYKSQQHSYRDFPLRLAEMGLVHRHERSGALHGLMRVRAFTQDDAHLFLLPEQITEEIKGVIELVDRFYKLFGFEYHVELSTKPEKAMGSDEVWEQATEALAMAMKEKGLEYKINEGDGAFYGPKLDFHLKDSLGRTWQCGTIQLDFQMPEKFDLTYVGADGQRHRPVMVHRVVFGSIERFIGILTEHYAGAFPAWLAPVQVRFLPIADRHVDYCYKLKKEWEMQGLRVEIDDRNEKIGFKIRQGQLEKVPYLLVAGDKEVDETLISVRKRSKGDLGAFNPASFLEQLVKEIAEKEYDED